MDVVTTLFDGETGLDGAGRPGGDDLEHSGTSQDDGRRLSLTKGIQASTDLPGLLHQIANLVISISKEWEETW